MHPLSPAERAQAQVASGLVVDEVANGPARRAGIQAGDIIVAVNGEMVSSIAQLQSQISKTGKSAALLVQRGNQRMFVPLHLG